MVQDHQRKSHTHNKRNRDGEEKNANQYQNEELINEKKIHNVTKKELQALKVEYKLCKEELMNVQEEKDRLKIKVNNLTYIVDISGKSDIQIIEDSNNIDKSFTCEECNYPFTNIIEKNNHRQKHKVQTTIMDIKQICSLCSLEFTLYKVFMEHIENNHSSEFNCQECDFQAGSSRIVLAKHLNLRHRKIEEQTDDTLTCNQCEQQFSAQWNLKNHIRDNHEKLTIVNILNKEVVVFQKMSAGISTNTLLLQVKEQICRREKKAMFAKQSSKGSMI